MQPRRDQKNNRRNKPNSDQDFWGGCRANIHLYGDINVLQHRLHAKEQLETTIYDVTFRNSASARITGLDDAG